MWTCSYTPWSINQFMLKCILSRKSMYYWIIITPVKSISQNVIIDTRTSFVDMSQRKDTLYVQLFCIPSFKLVIFYKRKMSQFTAEAKNHLNRLIQMNLVTLLLSGQERLHVLISIHSIIWCLRLWVIRVM